MKRVFTRIWSSDRSLSVLLALLGVMLFIVFPLEDTGVVGRIVISFVFSLILVSGVGVVAKGRIPTLLVGSLAGVNFAAHGMSFWRGGATLAAWDAAMALLFCGVLAGVVLIQVFREGPVTFHRIQGAVAVYLLLGFGWSCAYRLVALEWPDAFAFASSIEAALPNDHPWRFVYFSFVTLTTVGYGDITATHPVAQSLVLCEALTGQLFPAILLARLVSMELYHRQARKD